MFYSVERSRGRLPNSRVTLNKYMHCPDVPPVDFKCTSDQAFTQNTTKPTLFSILMNWIGFTMCLKGAIQVNLFIKIVRRNLNWEAHPFQHRLCRCLRHRWFGSRESIAEGPEEYTSWINSSFSDHTFQMSAQLVVGEDQYSDRKRKIGLIRPTLSESQSALRCCARHH